MWVDLFGQTDDAAQVAHGRDRETSRFGALSVTAVMLAALAACGGGGGGASSDAHESPTGTSSGASGGTDGAAGVQPTAKSAPVANAAAFLFVPTSGMASSDALATATGGTTFASWNPADAANSLRPGMKVTFFGSAAGCDGVHNGQVGSGDAGRFDMYASLTGLTTPDTNPMRWTPLGSTNGCAAASQSLSGDSQVQMAGDDSGGAISLYTHTGVHADGSAAFFGAFGAAGQNGAGANAYIAGSFVAFRQDWKSSAALAPWSANGSARIYTVQSVASVSGIANGTGSQPIQAKQEILASFINPACVAQMNGAHPCQLQYAVSTAIVRSAVSDWNTVGWFNAGKVWFDPAQGGTPIIDGPIKASGTSTNDGDSGLLLYTSNGSATQHGTFANTAFDVSISFAQLQNAMRIVTAKTVSKDIASVTDQDMATVWGSSWNVPAAWMTMSGSVGQEVYNQFTDREAFMGGKFSTFYIGPDA